MRVLVLNAGSSSLRASVIDTPETTRAFTKLEWGSDATLTDNREGRIHAALEELERLGAPLESFDAVGHRVVHGGTQFVETTLVDDRVLAGILAASALAPLHNTVALDTIRAAQHLLPRIPHVAAFDTAFHATMEPAAYRYPVPEAWFTDWGVRRFGFHGLSVEWAVRHVGAWLGQGSHALVVAHLGSGCSVTAVLDGRSVQTSMGMTPLEGLMMGTRSGSVDPGMLMRLLVEGKVEAAAMESALEHDAGMLGVSGVSGDLREVEAAAARGDERATLAVEMFTRRAAAAIGSAATALPRVDAIVFTGGIGENAGQVRAAIVRRLGSLGFDFQPPARIAGLKPDAILESSMAPAIAVIEAREDLVIAGDAARLLA